MNSKSFTKKFLAYLFISSFLFGLTYTLIFYETDPYNSENFGDQSAYFKIADHIISGDLLNKENVLLLTNKNPGYPLVLSILKTVFGEFIWSGRILNIILFSLLPIFIFLITKTLVNTKTAVISSLISSVYLPLMMYTPFLLTEIVFTFLIILSAYFLILSVKKRKHVFYLSAGLLLSVTTLIRGETFFLTLLFVVVLLFFKTRTKFLFLFLTFFILPLIPLSYINYANFGTVLPVEVLNGPLNLWMATHEDICIKELGSDAPGPCTKYFFSGLTVKEKKKKGLNEATEVLLNDPGRFLFNSIYRARGFLFGTHSMPNSYLRTMNIKESFKKDKFLFFVKILILILNSSILILGLFGLNILKVDKTSLFLITPFFYKLISHALIHSELRYQVPVMPFMIILFSYFIYAHKKQLNNLFK